jgi:hypothetical protein
MDYGKLFIRVISARNTASLLPATQFDGRIIDQGAERISTELVHKDNGKVAIRGVGTVVGR